MSDETPELTLATAKALAAGEDYVIRPPYRASVYSTEDDWVKLCVTRMIGGVAREYSMALQTRGRLPHEFAEAARRGWLSMQQEAEDHRRIVSDVIEGGGGSK